jgi:hypothetical protein
MVDDDERMLLQQFGEFYEAPSEEELLLKKDSRRKKLYLKVRNKRIKRMRYCQRRATAGGGEGSGGSKGAAANEGGSRGGPADGVAAAAAAAASNQQAVSYRTALLSQGSQGSQESVGPERNKMSEQQLQARYGVHYEEPDAEEIYYLMNVNLQPQRYADARNRRIMRMLTRKRRAEGATPVGGPGATWTWRTLA